MALFWTWTSFSPDWLNRLTTLRAGSVRWGRGRELSGRDGQSLKLLALFWAGSPRSVEKERNRRSVSVKYPTKRLCTASGPVLPFTRRPSRRQGLLRRITRFCFSAKFKMCHTSSFQRRQPAGNVCKYTMLANLGMPDVQGQPLLP